MTGFVRGSAIVFKALCLDETGRPFTPGQAELSIVYVDASGKRDSVVVPMAINGNTVSASWDSSVAIDSLPVVWHVRASNALHKVAKDGSFMLSAAEANPIG